MQEISERLLLAASNTIDTHGFAPGAGTAPSHPRRADTSPAPDFTRSPLSHGHVWSMVCFSRPPPPDVTIPKSNLQGIFCRVCRVHHSRHNYTGPPCCMAVSPKGSLTFSFFQSPTEQAPMQFQNFSNGHRFQTSLCFSLEWHTDPKTWSFFASYPNLINHWKNCHHSLTHAVPTRFVCHVLSTYPLHHVPLVA